VEFTVQVAAQAGARRLALFHHDPEHDDATVDALARLADERARQLGVSQVIAASEGTTLSLAAVSAGAR